MAQRTRTNRFDEALTGNYFNNYGSLRDQPFGKNISQRESITDVVTPGYFAALKSGAILPMNSASKTFTKIVDRRASQWGYNITLRDKPYAVVRYSGISSLGLLGPSGPSFSADNFPSLTEHDVAVMYTAALASAKAQGMDILTFYAEYRKTVDLVVGLAGRVVQRAHDLVRFKKLDRIKDRKAFISAFSDSWLEYRYGWRILAYDIESVSEIMKKLDNGISLRFKAKAGSFKSNSVLSQSGSRSSLSFSQLPSGNIGGSGLPYRCKFAINESHELRSHAGVLIESYLRSLVTVDPFLTAHELVPYSHVVDWFFNVNKWITAVSPLLDERLLQAYKRIDLVKTKTYAVEPDTQYTHPSGLEKWVPFGGSSSFTIETGGWERSPLIGEEQQLTLAYVNSFDKLKAVDAAALLWGRIRVLRKFTSI